MCCNLSQKSVKTCGKIMCFMSTLLSLFTAVVLYVYISFGGMEMLVYPEYMGNRDASYIFRDAVFGYGLVICAFTFALSFWACCTNLFKNKCSLCLFMLFSFIFVAVIFCMGAIFVGIGRWGKGYAVKSCNTIEYDGITALSEYEQLLWLYPLKFDDLVVDGLNKEMCTTHCPCLMNNGEIGTSTDAHKQYAQYNEYWYNEAGRTKFRSIRQNTKYQQMTWSSYPNRAYTSMIKCYEDLEKSNFYKIKDYGFNYDNIQFMKYIESEFKCSGVCRSSLFYFTLELDQGKPEQTCLKSILDSMGQELAYLGFALLILSGLILLTVVCSCSLCKYDHKAEMKEMDEEFNIVNKKYHNRSFNQNGEVGVEFAEVQRRR